MFAFGRMISAAPKKADRLRQTIVQDFNTIDADMSPELSDELKRPAITLRIYSHWVPGMRRITTAVLDTKEENANKMQMQASDGEK